MPNNPDSSRTSVQRFTDLLWGINVERIYIGLKLACTFYVLEAIGNYYMLRNTDCPD